MKEQFKRRLSLLKSAHQKLISQPNTKLDQHSGVYWRYKNPVLTAQHVPLFWRYDL